MSWPSMCESEITATSAASSSWCSLMKESRLGLPISSSPSKMHLRLTGGAPAVSRNDSAALTWTYNCPLSSDTPRAKRSCPTTVGSKGGVRHRSNGSGGWTS